MSQKKKETVCGESRTPSLNINLGEKYRDLPIFIYKTIDSTNLRAKLYAKEHPGERAVFIAEEQTMGRGRLGRSFDSKAGLGLYLSILLEGGTCASDAIGITTYMGTVAKDAIEEEAPLDVKIKWVNDLFVGGRKLGGILTEGGIDPETGKLLYSVTGIGINILDREFPEELRDIATSIEGECGKKVDTGAIASNIITKFLDSLHLVGTREIVDKYRRASFIIGKAVRVIKGTSTYPAYVDGIDDSCRLILTLDDGTREILSTGEVSIRPVNLN